MGGNTATYNKLAYERYKQEFVCDWCGESFTANKYNQARREWNACSQICGSHLRGQLKRKPHRIVDGVEQKECSICEEWKSLAQFSEDKSKWDGLHYQCRVCSNASVRKYRSTEKGKFARRRDNVARRALEAEVGKLTIQMIRRVHDENVEKHGELTCEYCDHVCSDDWHLEHKTPLSRGGDNERENLCISCPACNLKKWTKTDEEFLKIA